MKLIRYLLAGVLAPVLLGGCTSEESETLEPTGDRQSVFYIYTQHNGSGTDMRSVMDASGNVKWVTADRINVNGIVNTETDITWNNGTETRFGFAIEPIAERGIYYAVYPAVAADGTNNTYQTGSGGKFNVRLPQEQPYKNGTTFSDKINLSVASGSTSQMLFFNVCGIVQASLKVSRGNIAGIKKVRFVSNTNKAVSGTGIVDAVTKKITLNAGQSESVDIVFATPQTITSSTPLPVLWSLPINSYEAGWKIQLLGESNEVLSEVAPKEALTVQRSKITSLGTVEMQVTSNSYMLTPGETVEIPVIRANESPIQLASYPMVNGRCVQLASTDAWTADIVWQEEPNMITLTQSSGVGPLSKFKVTAGSIKGNAVVAIRKNSTKEILWSWHIWVTSYTGAETFTSNNGDRNVVFMDRDLGAESPDEISNSLFYQWGRKDPFPRVLDVKSNSPRTFYNSTGDIVPLQTVYGVNTGLTNSVRNPFSFYIGTYGLEQDWYGKSDGQNLWGGYPENVSTLAQKSVFDPCPIGWRVPASRNGVSPFAKMSFSIQDDSWNGTPNFTGQGWRWAENGFFPCPGLFYGDNNISGDSTDACYWTATVSNGRVLYFQLSLEIGWIANTNQRMTGGSVRCEKE